MGAVSSIVDSVSNTVSGAVSGVGDILQGDISQGLKELGPAAITAGTMWATGGMGGGLESLIAEDAASLAAQGLAEDQIASTLASTYGIDQYAASNLGSIAASGGSVADMSGMLAGDYGANMAGIPQSAAGSSWSLQDMAKAINTGGQLLGGVGKIASGIMGAKGTGVNASAADPFAQYRPGYADKLNAVMVNPNLVTELPGYQFNLRQGLDAMSAKQAQQGRLASGGALLESNAYGQNYAQNALKDYIGTLAQFSGATQAPGIGSTAAANIGAANLGSTMGGINAVSQGVGQISNPIATLYSMYNTGSPTIG